MHQGPEHLDLIELLHLEPDGELSRVELRKLDQHVESCRECESTRKELRGLVTLLEESKLEVHPDFSSRVAAGLPAASWELRRPASWRLAAGAFLALVLGAYAFTWIGSPLGEALPLMAAFGSLAELFRSAALAGAGLLSASWQGLGSVLGELLRESPVGFVVFGLFVLGLDFLFLRFLWRLSRRSDEPVYAAPSDRPEAPESGSADSNWRD